MSCLSPESHDIRSVCYSVHRISHRQFVESTRLFVKLAPDSVESLLAQL